MPEPLEPQTFVVVRQLWRPAHGWQNAAPLASVQAADYDVLLDWIREHKNTRLRTIQWVVMATHVYEAMEAAHA